MVTNAEHLQHVSSLFASTTDLVLVAGVDQGTIELPVHAVIMSERSQLLQDAIQQLEPANTTRSPPRLQMQGDDAAAVQAALDCLYPYTFEVPACRGDWVKSVQAARSTLCLYEMRPCIHAETSIPAVPFADCERKPESFRHTATWSHAVGAQVQDAYAIGRREIGLDRPV